MKHIKRCQATLINKDDDYFAGEYKGVKNAWWVFYETEKIHNAIIMKLQSVGV